MSRRLCFVGCLVTLVAACAGSDAPYRERTNAQGDADDSSGLTGDESDEESEPNADEDGDNA